MDLKPQNLLLTGPGVPVLKVAGSVLVKWVVYCGGECTLQVHNFLIHSSKILRVTSTCFFVIQLVDKN
jgi:hypothetical protein